MQREGQKFNNQGVIIFEALKVMKLEGKKQRKKEDIDEDVEKGDKSVDKYLIL